MSCQRAARKNAQPRSFMCWVRSARWSCWRNEDGKTTVFCLRQQYQSGPDARSATATGLDSVCAVKSVSCIRNARMQRFRKKISNAPLQAISQRLKPVSDQRSSRAPSPSHTAHIQSTRDFLRCTMGAPGLSAMEASTLPAEIASTIEDVGLLESIPLWAVTLLGSLFIWVLSLVMILTVYGRFFKLYMATAIAPIPLSSFAGQPSSSIGMAFIKSYAAICLEGCVILLACIIFSQFASWCSICWYSSAPLKCLTGSSGN